MPATLSLVWNANQPPTQRPNSPGRAFEANVRSPLCCEAPLNAVNFLARCLWNWLKKMEKLGGGTQLFDEYTFFPWKIALEGNFEHAILTLCNASHHHHCLNLDCPWLQGVVASATWCKLQLQITKKIKTTNYFINSISPKKSKMCLKPWKTFKHLLKTLFLFSKNECL